MREEKMMTIKTMLEMKEQTLVIYILQRRSGEKDV